MTMRNSSANVEQAEYSLLSNAENLYAMQGTVEWYQV